jgi:hypothetical protein
METHPSDLGASIDATLSRSRVRRRRLRTAVVAALAFTAGGLTVAAVPIVLSWMKSPPTIRSIISLQPKKYWFMPAPSPEEARREFVLHTKTQESRIRTNAVLNPALGSSEVQKIGGLIERHYTVDWLREHLQIDVSEDSSQITLSIHGASPEEQAVLVNAVTDSCLRVFHDLSEARYESEQKQTEKVYGRCRDELAAKRTSLLEVEKKGDLIEASALRDEIAVKEELVKRLLSSIEELKLQKAFPQEVVLVDKASVPNPN